MVMDYYSYCEDEALKVKVEGLPIHGFFSPIEFIRYGLGFDNAKDEPHNQVLVMEISDFLGLAEPIPDDDEKRHAPQEEFKKDVMSGKKTDWELPYLQIKENEDGIWKVVGHDGRHRGMLLKSIGYATMPVRLQIEGELNEELLPEILWCQNDKNQEREKDYYPFPLTDENFNKPYVTIENGTATIDGTQTVIAMDEDVGNWTMDFGGKAPAPCVEAKRNFSKNYVENVAYRKDNTMPASNLKEYLSKRGHRGFID